MDVTADNSDARADGDRRMLPRDGAGRRDSDRAQWDLFADDTSFEGRKPDLPGKYALLAAAMFLIGLTAIKSANSYLAPLLHDEARIERAAEVLAAGKTYLTYDLNIETRALRHGHIRGLDRTPEVAVLGASHWQEGHADLAGSVDFYNAHVHRDYYEDMLSVTEMFVRYGKLPKKMIITIRDNLFAPVEARTDFLWVPTLPYYRRMAARLELPAHNAYASGFTPQLRQQISLPLLKANIERYLAAPVKPGPSDLTVHPTLDALLPDGSVQWSDIHNAAFTPESSRQKALSFARTRRDNPPKVDPAGVVAIDTLLGYLRDKGVTVYLAHPPFNPVYWDAVQGSEYAKGLRRIEDITRDLARKHKLEIIGGFNPYPLGCGEELYIDGEHSRPECLGKIINQFLQHDMKLRGSLN